MRKSLVAFALIVCALTTGSAPAAEPFTLSVMTFNVNDLPWPLREKASSAMKIIGRDLARRHAEGTAPDVVLLQEAFTRRSLKLIRKAGYPHVVKGPNERMSDPADRVIEYYLPKDAVPDAPRRNYNRFVGSGLYILSRYPIVHVEKKVYGNDCSGTDCAANKGILYVRVRIPEHDATVSLATTHMDSNTKEGKRSDRFDAHWAQTGTLMSFLDRVRRGHALILAGDLNIKDGKRYAHFVQASKARNAGELCVTAPDRCAIGDDTDPNALTRATNDYHFVIDGADYEIEPVVMARTYQGKMAGKRLSDHSAFEATYRLTPK